MVVVVVVVVGRLPVTTSTVAGMPSAPAPKTTRLTLPETSPQTISVMAAISGSTLRTIMITRSVVTLAPLVTLIDTDG